MAKKVTDPFVAPPTGAWIETSWLLWFWRADVVAPPTGAWIETILGYVGSSVTRASPLPQGRGLKQREHNQLAEGDASPLPQGRGLKQNQPTGDKLSRVSPLPQGRGLKHDLPLKDAIRIMVAPPTGAWIETRSRLQRHGLYRRRPSHRGVD